MRILSSLLCVLVALLPVAASAAEAGWRLEKDKDGIQIYTRAVEGKSIREIRGTTEVTARLSSVAAVLSDVDAIPLLSDVVAEAKVTKRDSETRFQVYSVLKMPWPVTNRDLLNLTEIGQDPQTLAVTISNVGQRDGVATKEGLVRITDSRSQWRLTPATGGKVSVEMLAFTDPAGSLPTSLINSLSVGAPFKSMGVLRELARQPKYRDATLSFVREP